MRVPEAMAGWAEKTFDVGVDEVATQRIVRVSNVVTGEGTLFNGLRARRPVRAELKADERFDGTVPNDPWAEPEKSTPEDLFRRLSSVRGHGITAANIAKYDAVHSIIVFTDPNPLAFTRETITDQLDLARRWITVAHEDDREAIYPYVMWNCLWRAGGSIVHGHMQMSLARGRHYVKIERLRRDAEAYQAVHGVSYFEELLAVHRALGLSVNLDGVDAMAHLTPLKEKEVVLMGSALNENAASSLHHVLAVFRDDLGVQSFNVGMLLPPVAPVDESWDGFPLLMRIVDRGAVDTRSSDMGGMELFAESVVASDPFVLREALGVAKG